METTLPWEEFHEAWEQAHARFHQLRAVRLLMEEQRQRGGSARRHFDSAHNGRGGGASTEDAPLPSLPHVTIYATGACICNPGVGGWALYAANTLPSCGNSASRCRADTSTYGNRVIVIAVSREARAIRCDSQGQGQSSCPFLLRRYLLDSRCGPAVACPADSRLRVPLSLVPLLLPCRFPCGPRCCLATSIATMPDVALTGHDGGPGDGLFGKTQSTYSKRYRRLPLCLWSCGSWECRTRLARSIGRGWCSAVVCSLLRRFALPVRPFLRTSERPIQVAVKT